MHAAVSTTSCRAAGSKALDHPLEDEIGQTVALVIYPRCIAVTVDGEINGKSAKIVTVEEFLELPAEIGEAWLSTVLELNPAWRPGYSASEVEAEKKG